MVDACGCPTVSRWRTGPQAVRLCVPLELEDVGYHLTTLFPPIRPRGFLELRFLDALPAPWWQAAAAVTTAVMNDTETALVAEHACRDLSATSVWSRAEDTALRDPAIAAAASAVLKPSPPRCRGSALRGSLAQSSNSRDRFTERGRCPADDALALDVAGVLS